MNTLTLKKERSLIASTINQGILADSTIAGGLLIGSIHNKEADEYSDIDYYISVTTPIWSRDQLDVRPVGLLELHLMTE